jgi:hypothetical protein
MSATEASTLHLHANEQKEDDMPRKQRFKPSRKPKPMVEATQEPNPNGTAPTNGAAHLEPGSKETERVEAHHDDVERERERERSIAESQH